MLKPIHNVGVVDLVYEQIRDLIFSGQLKPGDRLMPEREMAQTLKVSRVALREAIRKLSDHNLVEKKHGSGTFVVDAETRRQSGSLLQLFNGQDFSVQEFLEVRLALECNGAALAAKRATEQDIQLLERNIEELKAQQLKKPEERTPYIDFNFHMNISLASRNTVQIYLMKYFHDIMLFGQKEIFTKLDRKLGERPFLLQQHLEIVKAIKIRDSDLAQKAMRIHIETTMKDYANL